MIIAPLNPTMLPLAIGIWSVDAFLWIVLCRLLLSRLPLSWAASTSWGLAALADPAQRGVQRAVFRLMGNYCSNWQSWIVLIIALLVVHHFLLWLAVHTL